jgi:Notch-like protein
VPSPPELCNGLDDDCDTLTDEDWVLASDPLNCGACGNVCNVPHVVEQTCRYNTCIIGDLGCAAGWLDCTLEDGCETAVDSAHCGGCTVDCPGGRWQCCAPATVTCTDTYNAANCGSCGNNCGVSAYCCYGICCADTEACCAGMCCPDGCCATDPTVCAGTVDCVVPDGG